MTSYYGPYSSDYDDVPMRRANNEWRNDPARLEAARARISEIGSCFDQAHDLLKQAVDAFAAAGLLDPDEDAQAARCQKALLMTLTQFDRDAPFVTDEPTDTYLGNKAAFGYAMKD